ncbi:winged helix-turn-helix domain-containing protein [Gemmata sp. JC673]|uniref:Winged helix-turn-helix domain-containing protein n=1 Tax=Gemmata algarum TaxID=2975278 RepID=A0ABU5EVW6_9BACT|nr:helix-turn-helix domain-containing protein [Gemmata algarum]MDY3559446.1 winged helix-turn-helix domain-containing protein [Gemmata algarum]
MSQLAVSSHLTVEQIDERYRSCSEGAEKSRWHVLWLITRPERPMSATAAAKLVGFTPAWGRAILKRYNAHGPDGLSDRRRDNGARFQLNPQQQAELFTALQKSAPDGGLWSGPKVAAWVRERFGGGVVNQTRWQWLEELGFRLVVPRPRHPKAATREQQQEWL